MLQLSSINTCCLWLREVIDKQIDDRWIDTKDYLKPELNLRIEQFLNNVISPKSTLCSKGSGGVPQMF